MELDDTIKTIDVMFETGNSSNGNSDNPRFENLKQLGLENVVAYQFLFANVPFVYNVIDSTQNQFILTDVNNAGGVTVTLPVGTYSSTQWPYIFSRALQTASVSGYADYLSFYDTVTNQIVIVNNAATSITFTISTTPANNIGKYDVFGFNEDTVYTAQTSPTLYYNGSLNAKPWSVATPYYIASQYTANLSGANEMYLHSDLSSAFKTNGLVSDTIQASNTPGTIGSGDVIAFWPVNTISSGTIRFTPNFQTVCKAGAGSQINSLNFYLTLGTQVVYGTSSQYSATTTTVPYLPLGGTSWQIGIRFFTQGTQLIHQTGQSIQAILPINQQPPRFPTQQAYAASFPNKKPKTGFAGGTGM
jgi:hypothetical protein